MPTLTRLPRPLLWLVAVLTASGAVLGSQALYVDADAAGIEWVDGGDDLPCLNDDTGRALDALPQDKFCTPINGCYQDDDGKWVLPSRKTGIWQGDPSQVKYADELNATPTPRPTPKPSPKPTPRPGGGSSDGQDDRPAAGGSTGSGGSGSTGSGGASAGALADLGIDEDEEVAEGAPTAPEAPELSVDGQDVTVTFEPTADADLEGVTGYVLRFSDADPVELDADTTEHVFTDLEDGEYRAAVRAVNDAGESASSAPSDVAVVGDPEPAAAGAITVDGDLTPGSTLSVTGTGFAAESAPITLELRADEAAGAEPATADPGAAAASPASTGGPVGLAAGPVQIGVVAPDAEGAFAASVTIPADAPAGDHTLALVQDGADVTSTVLSVVADVAPAAAPVTVPPLTGLVILAVLAAAGAGALLWHGTLGRRTRRRGETATGPALAAGVG